jgi:hypothetical protein
MLVLDDALEDVPLIVVLLLSVRRNWKLANLALERGCELPIEVEVEARWTGRGAESTGVSALEGRKQLNGMIIMCRVGEKQEWCGHNWQEKVVQRDMIVD